MQFVTTGEASLSLLIEGGLFTKVQFVTVGDELLVFYIPPPIETPIEDASFAETVQPVRVGEASSQ